MRLRKGDYIQRIDGISIYCVTAAEDQHVHVVRCSNHSISNVVKLFKKTEVRQLKQLSLVLTKHMHTMMQIYKSKDFPRIIRLAKTKANIRIITEKPDLLTFRTRERSHKLFYTFTYNNVETTEHYIYLRLIECINKTCGQKGI